MRNRTEIKYEARRLIRTGNVPVPVAGAIVVVVQVVLSELSVFLETGKFTVMQVMEFLRSGSMDVFLATAEPTTLTTFLTILGSLIIVVLTAGFYSYCMGIRKGFSMPYASLMDGFGIAGKVIWCRILVMSRIFLWSLLFVVPGIVAAYRYRFALYNLVRDDSLTALQAIDLSVRQTEGMKMELFILDLSFLGWEIASLLTFGILDIWRLPYVVLSDLGYYEDACSMMAPPAGSEPPLQF